MLLQGQPQRLDFAEAIGAAADDREVVDPREDTVVGMASGSSDHETLRAAWDSESEAWVRWARSTEADHAFWRLSLPCLVALLPDPGRLTLDVACGEGRVARRLAALGHRVVGIEGSPALARAARDYDPDFEVHVADAARVPLPDAIADLAVASLSLMNMDDLRGVVGEVARLLEPGARFCFSVVHPLSSWRGAGEAAYFDTVRFVERREREGRPMTFHDTHRPLGDYFAALEDSGFLVERVREPVPDDDHVREHPDAERWRSRPGFLHVRAVLGDVS